MATKKELLDTINEAFDAIRHAYEYDIMRQHGLRERQKYSDLIVNSWKAKANRLLREEGYKQRIEL